MRMDASKNSVHARGRTRSSTRPRICSSSSSRAFFTPTFNFRVACLPSLHLLTMAPGGCRLVAHNFCSYLWKIGSVDVDVLRVNATSNPRLCKLFSSQQFLLRISFETKALAFGCPQFMLEQIGRLFGYV
jgi:hypothetical protein